MSSDSGAQPSTSAHQLVPPLGIVRANVAATVVFVVSGVIGVIARESTAGKVLIIVVAMLLFVIGVATALWTYAAALERSRSDEIGVANLYLLTGRTAPAIVKLTMWGCLGVQVAAAVVIATIGAKGLGEGQLNTLAFAVLVPMLGIGLNGLWAVLHGSYGPRVNPVLKDGRR